MRKQSGRIQALKSPVNLTSIDAGVPFNLADRRQNIASFKHSHRNGKLYLFLNLPDNGNRAILFDLKFHSIRERTGCGNKNAACTFSSILIHLQLL
jgi:hypothetical protein